MSVTCMNVNVSCVCGAYRGQKRALDALELELRVFVSCHLGAESQTQVLKSIRCS